MDLQITRPGSFSSWGIITPSISDQFMPQVGSNSLTDGLNFIFDYLAGFSIAIGNFVEVREFLFSNPSIIAHLYELPEVLRPFADEKFILDIRVDETDDTIPCREMILTISSRKSPRDASHLLDEIERAWLFQIRDQNMQQFSFNLKFEA